MISVLAQAHTGNPTFDKRLDTALDLVEAGIGHNSAIAIEYIDTPVLKLDKGSAPACSASATRTLRSRLCGASRCASDWLSTPTTLF